MTRKRMKKVKKVRKFDERRIYCVYYLRRPDKVDLYDENLWGVLYVGKGQSRRAASHRSYALRTIDKKGNRRLVYVMIYKLWREGLDYIEDIMFDNLTEQEAFDIEMSAIAAYGRIDLGTGCLANHTDGGDGMSGHIYTEEHRRKISQSLIGNTRSLGHHPSEETRKKMSKPLSKEHVRKIAESNRGKVRTEAMRQRTSEARKGVPSKLKGVPRTEETKQKIRKAKKGKPLSETHKEAISKGLTGTKREPRSAEHSAKISNGLKLSWQRRKAKSNSQ